jgi:hypothetical protein
VYQFHLFLNFPFLGEGEGRENLAGTEWPDLDNIALPSVPENQNEIKTTNTHDDEAYILIDYNRNNKKNKKIFSCFFVLFSDDLGMLLYTCISIPPISFSMSELLPFLTIFPSLNTGFVFTPFVFLPAMCPPNIA